MYSLQEEDSEPKLKVVFPTYFHAMWDIILQTSAGPNADKWFPLTLSHRLMTYTLFITFIVAMPILFNNFLVGA